MTMIKSNLVDRDTLSTRIKELGLSNFLLMSEGDKMKESIQKIKHKRIYLNQL